jgi:hypothetical protein
MGKLSEILRGNKRSGRDEYESSNSNISESSSMPTAQGKNNLQKSDNRHRRGTDITKNGREQQEITPHRGTFTYQVSIIEIIKLIPALIVAIFYCILFLVRGAFFHIWSLK